MSSSHNKVNYKTLASINTSMGHMKMVRQGIQSTTSTDVTDNQSINLSRKHKVGSNMIKFEELKGLLSVDISGKYPITSVLGNKYIFVLYDYDSNIIIGEPMKSRQKEDIIAAYQTCYKILTKAGIHPILQRLDNEISDDLIQTIENNGLTYQIASPGDHRINPAEKAIQIYKDHYIAGMSGADPLLPTNQ